MGGGGGGGGEGGERNKVPQNKVFESSHFLVGLIPGYSSTSKLIWDTVENLLSWKRLSYFYTSTGAEALSGSQLRTRIWVRAMIGLLRNAIVRLVHQGEGKSENYFR